MKEATGNYGKALKHIKKHKNISLACICCKSVKIVTNKEDIFCIPFEGTIQCDDCYVDAVIPIVDDSVLLGKNDDEITEKLNIWHEEMMKPVEPEYISEK